MFYFLFHDLHLMHKYKTINVPAGFHVIAWYWLWKTIFYFIFYEIEILVQSCFQEADESPGSMLGNVHGSRFQRLISTPPPY